MSFRRTISLAFSYISKRIYTLALEKISSLTSTENLKIEPALCLQVMNITITANRHLGRPRLLVPAGLRSLPSRTSDILSRMVSS